MATNGLSRWEMLTKARPQQRVYSRSQRVATSNDIQDWIKKVQTASEQTAAVEAVESMYKASQKYSSHLNDAVAHVEDAAVLEAQALIEQYVKKKLNSDDEHGSESDDSTRIGSRSKNGAKSLWELVDVGNENSHFEDKQYEIVRNFHKKNDPFKILEKDDGELVNSVLSSLMKKDFVSDGYVKKFVHKEESGGIDPSTKMSVRHAQVKENREKRCLEKERRLRELQEMRDVQVKARQTLMKEEKQKEMQAKREEVELQKEMARLRKELEEERKKSEADQQKKLKEEEELKRLAKEELKKELAKEQEEARVELARANQKRERVLHKMAEIEKRRAKESLKLKRLAFSSWYGVVLERRINIGKAKATSDWKVLFRAFTGWKNQCKGRKAEQEASRHASLVKEMHRKELKASEHFRICLLRKIFSGWSLYFAREQNLRSQIKTQNDTKTKMAAFLEAAATGRLWTDRSQETGRANLSLRNQDKQTSANPAENGSFRQRRGSVGSFSSKSPHSSARSEETAARQNGPLSSSKVTRPSEPWQITRKHLHLVDELNLELSQRRPVGGRDFGCHDDDVGSFCARPSTSGPSRRPVRLKPAFAVNNYEHRHLAQQKMLDAQQNQLKEQKRLIEELQHLQRQQLAHQQLLMKAQVPTTTSRGAAAEVVESDLRKLQSHIDRMRKELEKNGAVRRFDDGEGTEPAASNRSNPESSAHPTGRSESSSAVSGISKPSDNPKHLRFLKAMEERASERERLRKEREERRRRQEEERLQQLKAEAEEKQCQEDEEKRQRLRDARQKKEQERQNQLKQQEEAERMRHLMAASEEHRRKSTMKFWGFLPWKKLVEDTKTKREQAIEKYNINLQRKVLLSWHTKIVDESKEKEKKADDMYHYLLVKRCIGAWKRCKNYAAIQEEKANRHYSRSLLHRIVTSWLDYSTEQKVKERQKERKAKEFHSMSIVRIAFRAWKRFPPIMKEDRSKRQRLEEMRKKVAAFIPDFQPPSVDLSQASLD